MPTATNPTTGEKVAWINGEWTPVERTATNKSTGERMALVGGQWQPLDYSDVEGPEKRSPVDEFGRQLGLTGRAVAGGLAQAAQPFTEPVRYGLNKLLPGEPVGNLEQATDEVLTKAGVPEPETGLERGVQGVGRFATSVGAGMGGAKGAEKALGIKPPAQAQPSSTQQLKEYSQALYQQADDAGVVISPASYGNVVKKMAGRVKEAGIDPTLHPKATAALKRLSEVGDEPIALKELETLRRVVKGAASSTDADEKRIAKIMSQTIDDYVHNLRPSDVVSGDAKSVSGILKEARNLWSRKSKSEMLERAIEKAGVRAGQFSGSGFENAIRTQFRQIAMNDKKIRMFSPEEQAAIKKVAMGGPIDNALRMLGKFAPRGVVSAGISSGIGYGMGGPIGAGAVMGAGELGRRGATAMTGKNVQNAVELMRRGGPAASRGVPQSIPPWMIGGVIGLDEPAY